MIGAVDAILRSVLLAGVPGLAAGRLSFQPPDDDWRSGTDLFHVLECEDYGRLLAELEKLPVNVTWQARMAELLDVAPLTLDNFYNTIDQTNGSARIRLLTDRLLFDNQVIKEVCNLMGLRQLGCSTGTLQDFGPDFGLSYVLDGMAAMGQK